MTKLINILIRHKEGRDVEFNRCNESILNQTYKKWQRIVYWDIKFDNFISLDKGTIHGLTPKHYNLHCNDLKAQVKDGWFFYLDDDDYLASPTVLEELSHHLFDGALIVQFIRKRRREHAGVGSHTRKPTDRMIHDKVIKKGMIGGGCLVLHHSFAGVADWKGKPAADFDWIKAVTDVVPTRFVPLVLQIADVKNNGR